jgi:hypothetical protein
VGHTEAQQLVQAHTTSHQLAITVMMQMLVLQAKWAQFLATLLVDHKPLVIAELLSLPIVVALFLDQL